MRQKFKIMNRQGRKERQEFTDETVRPTIGSQTEDLIDDF